MKHEKISLPVAQMIRRAAQQADEFLRQASTVPPSQAIVMLALATAAEGVMLNQTDIVEQTGIDRSTLAEMLGRMEAAKLISRKADPADARGRLVKLTRSGRSLVEKTDAAMLTAGDALMMMIPMRDRAAFLRSLEAISAIQGQGEK